MDGAEALRAYARPALQISYYKDKLCRVGGSLWYALKPKARARVELPQVQILVVVANIQTRTLKAEVEKGSM
jgi:hypothetical protein